MKVYKGMVDRTCLIRKSLPSGDIHKVKALFNAAEAIRSEVSPRIRKKKS